MKFFHSSLIKYFPYLLIISACFYSLYSIFYTGYVGDDAYNYQFSGRVLEENKSYFDLVLDNIYGWYIDSRRILLSQIFVFYSFYFINDLFVMKFYTILMVCLCILFYYKFILASSRNLYISLFIAFFSALAMQLREWHDPILIFPSHLMPITMILLMLSIYFFNKYLATHKFINFYISLFIYFFSLLVYEINFVFFPIFFILLINHERSYISTFILTAPYFLLSFSFLIFIYITKFYSSEQHIYNTVTLSFDYANFLTAFAIQLSSAIPGIYFYNQINLSHITFLYYDYIAFIIISITFFILLKKATYKSVNKKILLKLLCIGCIFLIAPALVSVLSSHQNELIHAGFGYGYITVFYQYFGFAILFFLVIRYLINNINMNYFRNILISIISVVFSIVFVYTSAANKFVSLSSNKQFKYPQQLLEMSIASGLMENIKENDFVFRNMRYASDWKWSYYKFLNKKIMLCDLSNQSFDVDQNNLILFSDCLNDKSFVFETLNSKVLQFTPKKNTWLVIHHVDVESGINGQSFLFDIKKIYLNKANGSLIHIDGILVRQYNQDEDTIFSLNINNIDILKLSSINNSLKLVNFENFSNKNKNILDFNTGKIYPTEYSQALDELNWVHGNFEKNIINLKKIHFEKKIDFNIVNPGMQDFDVSIKSNESVLKKIHIKKDSNISYHSINIKLKPGLNTISFLTDGKPISNGDPRDIIYGMSFYPYKNRNDK